MHPIAKAESTDKTEKALLILRTAKKQLTQRIPTNAFKATIVPNVLTDKNEKAEFWDLPDRKVVLRPSRPSMIGWLSISLTILVSQKWTFLRSRLAMRFKPK